MQIYSYGEADRPSGAEAKFTEDGQIFLIYATVGPRAIIFS